VLLASIPVSAASVVLTEKYSAPTDLVAAQVVLGVLLLLPTTLVWCTVLGVKKVKGNRKIRRPPNIHESSGVAVTTQILHSHFTVQIASVSGPPCALVCGPTFEKKQKQMYSSAAPLAGHHRLRLRWRQSHKKEKKRTTKQPHTHHSVNEKMFRSMSPPLTEICCRNTSRTLTINRTFTALATFSTISPRVRFSGEFLRLSTYAAATSA
jgi:hypothetical protein